MKGLVLASQNALLCGGMGGAASVPRERSGPANHRVRTQLADIGCPTVGVIHSERNDLWQSCRQIEGMAVLFFFAGLPGVDEREVVVSPDERYPIRSESQMLARIKIAKIIGCGGLAWTVN